mgnify:CR=1 FL=1
MDLGYCTCVRWHCQVEHGDAAIAEQAHAEASRATSLEEKEKLLSAVKQNVD